MPDHAPRTAQLSLQGLFCAVTTCGIAFAVMFRGWHPALQMMAACVPLFWVGFACHVAGEGLLSRRIRGLAGVGGFLSTAGVVLAASAALSSVLFLAVAVLSGLLSLTR
jgi:hypothetical protein